MTTVPLVFNEDQIQSLFGHEAAENEPIDRLRKYYFKGRLFDRLSSDTPMRIVVGHKGIGKSAFIKVAIEEDKQKGRIPILIRPDDVLEVQTDPSNLLKSIRAWKDGLGKIIVEKIFSELDTSSEVLSENGLPGLNVLNKLLDSLRPVIEKVCDPDKAKRILANSAAQSTPITVYIDDLDRGWEGQSSDIKRISALLNALRDMGSDDSRLRFRVSLRSDVYALVRTSDESTDKIEGAVLWLAWSNHEILALLVKRIESFFGREVSEERLLNMKQGELAKFMDPIFLSAFQGKGKWSNVPTYRVLMSLIRKRPRDLVKICTQAAHQAYDKKLARIGTSEIQSVLEDYSQERLQDTINEYKFELPDIQRLLMGMKPSKRAGETSKLYVFSTAELLEKMGKIAEQGQFRFAGGRVADAKDLAAFLYKINFLTARKDTGSGIIRKYFEENKYIANRFADFGFDWEIHPAYRWALQPDDPNKPFEEIDVSMDEEPISSSPSPRKTYSK